MLNVGLTGGIGAGKSAASSALVELGALLIDADRIAREVVAPGTEGLAQIVETFGPDVLAGDGSLDRPALARLVFGDEQALQRLNQITHPRVRARSDELMRRAGPGDVVVNDIPLLAEGTMAPAFHLVIVVHAPAETRLERLVTSRGMARDDARARIAAQASDEQRDQIADVLLDNSGEPGRLREQIERLWSERIEPYAAGLERREGARERIPAREGAQQRELARIRWALRERPAEVAVDRDGVFVPPLPGVREDLAGAGWFGESELRSADPGALLEVRWA